MTNGEIVIKGGVGTSASIGAWWIAHVELVNATLQTFSLILGATIGVVTLVKLFRKRKETQTPDAIP